MWIHIEDRADRRRSVERVSYEDGELPELRGVRESSGEREARKTHAMGYVAALQRVPVGCCAPRHGAEGAAGAVAALLHRAELSACSGQAGGWGRNDRNRRGQVSGTGAGVGDVGCEIEVTGPGGSTGDAPVRR